MLSVLLCLIINKNKKITIECDEMIYRYVCQQGLTDSVDTELSALSTTAAKQEISD